MTMKTHNGILIEFIFQLPELKGEEEFLSLEDKLFFISIAEDYLAHHPLVKVVNIVVFGNWEGVGVGKILDPQNNPYDALEAGTIFFATAHKREDCINCIFSGCKKRREYIFPNDRRVYL